MPIHQPDHWTLGSVRSGLITVALVASTFAFAVSDPAKSAPLKAADGKPAILMWDTLLLKESKKADDQKKLKEIGSRTYRIPGFMVPLETTKDTTNEFLLMPSLPACAHVPPPPPSQTVHVKMAKGVRAKIAWDPVWVEGTVTVKEGKQTGYGDASFEMQSSAVKILKPEDLNEVQKLLPPSTYVLDCNGRDKLEPACKGGNKKTSAPI